jgi:hypothetical protein
VPVSYSVEDVSSTVTFWPADVVMMKLDGDTLATVPEAPPAAGPDRALDPPAPEPGPPAAPPPGLRCSAVAGEDAAVADEDVESPRPRETPTAEHVSAEAAIQRFLLFDNNRRVLGRRACLARVCSADPSGESVRGGDAAALPDAEPPSVNGSDIALVRGSAVVSSGFVGS